MKNKTLKIKLNNGYANMFLADEFNGYSVYTGSEFLHLTTVKYLQQILGYGYDISKAPRVRFKNNLNEFEDLVVIDNIILPDSFNIDYNQYNTFLKTNFVEQSPACVNIKATVNSEVEIELKFDKGTKEFYETSDLIITNEMFSIYSYTDEINKEYRYNTATVLDFDSEKIFNEPNLFVQEKKNSEITTREYNENKYETDQYIASIKDGKILSDASGMEIQYNSNSKNKLEYVEEELCFTNKNVTTVGYLAKDEIVSYNIMKNHNTDKIAKSADNFKILNIDFNIETINTNYNTELSKDKNIILNSDNASLVNINNNVIQIPTSEKTLTNLKYSNEVYANKLYSIYGDDQAIPLKEIIKYNINSNHNLIDISENNENSTIISYPLFINYIEYNLLNDLSSDKHTVIKNKHTELYDINSNYKTIPKLYQNHNDLYRDNELVGEETSSFSAIDYVDTKNEIIKYNKMNNFDTTNISLRESDSEIKGNYLSTDEILYNNKNDLLKDTNTISEELYISLNSENPYFDNLILYNEDNDLDKSYLIETKTNTKMYSTNENYKKDISFGNSELEYDLLNANVSYDMSTQKALVGLNIDIDLYNSYKENFGRDFIGLILGIDYKYKEINFGISGAFNLSNGIVIEQEMISLDTIKEDEQI